MNWLDGVIIISLIFFTFEGFRKSFIGESLNFLSFLLALFLSLRFYNLISVIFEKFWQFPHSLSSILGFIFVWLLVETFFFGLIHLSFRPSVLTIKIDKLLGYLSAIPALLRGLVFISIILVVIGTFPIQPKLKQAVYESKIGSIILQQTTQLEAPLKNVFGGITTDSLNFLTVKPETQERVDLGFKLNQFKAREDLEYKMIELLNKERTTQRLGALNYNSQLQNIARPHSEDMFQRGYFSHYSPEGDSVAQRAEKAGFNYLIIGENLAYAPDLNLAHIGLMNSPGHRANILSKDYQQIGIGILDGGVYGLMITQVFSN